MKILLAVDGSHCTKRMLSYIAAHDDSLGPGHDSTLVDVIPSMPTCAAEFLESKTLDGYDLEESEKVFQPIPSFAEQQGWAVRLVHKPGHAAELIASLADSEHHDLIVMAAHGHSSPGNVVLAVWRPACSDAARFRCC